MLPTNQRAVNKGDLVLSTGNRLYSAWDDTEDTGKYTPQHLYIVSDEPIKEGDWYYTPIKRSIEQCVRQRLIIKGGENDITQLKIIATTDKSIAIEHSILSISQRKGLVNDYPVEKTIIPSPSPEFVKAYVKAYNADKKIEEVMVEYEPDYSVDCGFDASECLTHQSNEKDCKGCSHCAVKLKIDKDNCITITRVKDSWSREELDVILNDFASAAITAALHGTLPSDAKHFTKQWIERNL